MSNLSQKKGYKSHLVKKAAVALTVFTMASAGVVAIDSAHSEDAYAATALKKTSVKKFGNLKKGYTVYTGITLTKKAGTTDAHTAKTLYVQYSFQKNGKTYYRVLQNKKHFGVVEAAAFKQAGNGLNYFGAKNVISNRQVQITAKDSIYSNLNSFKVAGSTEDHIGEMTVSNGYFNHYNGQRYYALYQDGKLFGYVNTKALKANATDLTDLNAAIKAADELKAEDYTKASFEAFTKVLDEAKATAKKVGVNKADADAAVKSLDDATKALVKELRVESVSAINAKTLKVEFNTAVDTSKVTFDVKRGETTKTTVSGLEVTWNDAKTEATLTSSVNLAADTYTVTASGVDFAEGKNSATVKVEAQKVSKIEFVSTDLLKKSSPKDEATFTYKVTDQYGTDMTKTVADNAVSKSVVIGSTTGTLTLDPTKGFATVKKSGGDFNDTDKTAVITLVHGASGTTASATMNIVASATVADLTFGENILPKGKTNIETGLAEAVKVPVTVKDQYGNTLKDLATLNSAVSLVSSNAAKFKFDVDADGNTFVIMDTSLLTDKGTVVLTAVNPSTGKSFTKSFNVVKPVAADKITVGEFQSAVIANGDQKIGLAITVHDQFGNELTKEQIAKNATTINNWISGDTAKLGTLTVDTDKNSKTYGMLVTGTVTGASGTKDEPAVLVFNAPGGVVTKTVTIKPARVSETVEKVDATTLLQGASKELKFAFKDQYGEVQKTPVNNPKLKYSIEFKKLSGDDNALTLTKVNGVAKSLTDGKYAEDNVSDLASFEVQAASDKTGAYQVTVNLIDTTTNLAVSSASTTVTVAKNNVEGLVYNVADIPTLDGSANRTGDITVDANRSVYAQKIVVDATDANGNKYVINKDDIISVTSNNAKIVAGQGATSKEWYVASNQLTLPTDKDTATLTVKVNTLDGIKTFTKEVKASTAAPVVQELKLVSSAITATKDDKTVNDKIAGSTFEFADKKAAIDTGLAIHLAGKDQYGVWNPVTVDGTTNKIFVNSTDLATVDAFTANTQVLKLAAANKATAQKDIKATIVAGNATAEIVINIAAADKITGVQNVVGADATFTITSNFKHTLAVGDIDMDPNTAGVQDNVTINGVKYTVTVNAGTATVAATQTATAATTEVTKSPIVISVKDSKVNASDTLTLNLAAVAAGAVPGITVTTVAP